MRRFALILALLASGLAFGRGESWVPKPPVPPPVATLTNEARYVEWKWREDVTDPKTGVTQEQAKEKLLALAKELEPKEPWNVVKAECFAWLCDNLAIDVSPLDWFPAFACWNRYARPISPVLGRRNGEIERRFYPEILSRMHEGNRQGKWMVWKDFDHIVPDWDTVIPLGFAGLKARLVANWQEEKPYYRAEKIAAEGIERLLDRLIEKGERGLSAPRSEGAAGTVGKMRLRKQMESLKRLKSGAPQTAYDVMQFIYLYFVLSEHFEGVQARSLSIIDRTLWPYYGRDLAAGRTTEAEFREQFKHFLWQWGSIDNYWGQPVTMGGTKADGTTEYNPLSYVILDVMDECALPSPKFHLKIAGNTPDDLLRKAFNPALLASLAGAYSVKTGRDALSTGTPSGNRTGHSLSGFGTAVDALLAVKKLVYERKELSLAELGRLMAVNWEGREDLRLRMLRSKRKWGNNDPEANALGREISKVLSSVVNGQPNTRGGCFTLSGHNARQFICEGRLTGATPDGRKRGDEFSKNLSPTMGADTEGVTALVATLASLDSRDFPGDFPLDVMLLPYTVAGEKGLEVMKSLLAQYYANGGLIMQFNIFDAEELKDAQRHPEKYENLQVRVCGWNVRWNDLPKREQDAYIRRAEMIAR